MARRVKAEADAPTPTEGILQRVPEAPAPAPATPSLTTRAVEALCSLFDTTSSVPLRIDIAEYLLPLVSADMKATILSWLLQVAEHKIGCEPRERVRAAALVLEHAL